MTYHIDVNFEKVIVVGAGGTGSMIIDGLCRLLIKKPDIPIYIIDYDRVKKKNILRQNFYPQDIGKFKSQVLAERYALIYGRKIAYYIAPFDEDIIEQRLAENMGTVLTTNALIIGCVDTHTGRAAMARACRMPGTWWLDSGNGYNSGQVLFGNAVIYEQMINSFLPNTNEMRNAPTPSMQQPSLLMPAQEKADLEDCAAAIENEKQSPIINQTMAIWILEFVRRIISHELSWLGVYVDMDAGTVKTVPAEPYIVSRMLSIKENQLIKK